MDTGIFKEMIAVIRAEQQRRDSLLRDKAPYYENDQWRFNDEPFLNELCLMLLVALRHQIERELVDFATRAVADEGEEINLEQYEAKRRALPRDWEEIHAMLKTASCKEYETWEALRLLTNSYKHDPSKHPSKKLLQFLKLETNGKSYASLPESDALRERLAALIGLGKNAGYCDITERFVDISSEFLVDVQRRTRLGRVKRSSASFKISKFAR